MANIYVFDHPLIKHKTTLMRMKETGTKDFRQLAREVAMLMLFEATRELPTEKVKIETPICETEMEMLAAKTSQSCRSCVQVWAWSTGSSI